MISFTSDFIPRLVYLYMYSKDGTMHGFVNHTLSSFDVSDFQNGTAPNDPLDLGYKVHICRYCSRQLSLKSHTCWAAGKPPVQAGILSGASHGTAQSCFKEKESIPGVRVGGHSEIQGNLRHSWIQALQRASRPHWALCPTLLSCVLALFPSRQKDPSSSCFAASLPSCPGGKKVSSQQSATVSGWSLAGLTWATGQALTYCFCQRVEGSYSLGLGYAAGCGELGDPKENWGAVIGRTGDGC